MADKYLALDTTNLVPKQVEATVTSAGTANAGDVVALDEFGYISSTMLRENETKVLTATEAIGAGKFVNLWENGGTKMRLASNAGISTKAEGFVLEAVASGATGTVYMWDGINSALTSLTASTDYYLGTAGGIITGGSVPLTTNSIVQFLGKTSATTELLVDIDERPIIA